ncbi:MAG: CHAT domain-containing protein, partial [Sulfuricellaceae bacterium]
MPDHFDLIVSVKDYSATFRLLNDSGAQIAYRHTDFTPISISRQHGLFNLRDYVQLYVAADDEAAAVAEIGVCIAEDVLGQEIFEPLWRAQTPRTLRIQLPGATEQQNPLATALARVPWEIARPAPDQPTLAQRNLIVRIVNDLPPPASQPLAPDEALRVLFIFAEARDANPLSLRRERRELMQLFEQEIYPQRRVVADILSHGVTRERLEEQIQQNNGYHIVHWSGHGHKNQLLLAKPGGNSDHLSGEELLALFTDAGVFLPRLFFLSACHSGDILAVRDWNDFLAVALGKKPHAAKTRELGAPPATLKDLNLEQPSGYTGTAHALLHGGVPSVVAMRYAVGDDYARELAVEFYRALLAHPQPKDAASALNLARRALLNEKKHDPAHHTACDHATPLLYGAEQPGLTLNPGRSAALDPRDPRLHKIAELTATAHRCFVGRTWELAGLGANFIAPGAPQQLAVITGLGGMGKTALTAEALALWEKHYTWVLLYQAKPNALSFDNTLRDIHQKLNAELGRYHHHIKNHPADAIYREADADFTGDERLARLTRNLVRALRDEAILLVLDNFETNLAAHSEAETAAACQDPAWDRCLGALARELGGAPSRVLITSRRPLAVTESHSHFIAPLGPLPSGEAALYLREHPVLSKMAFGADRAETTLAQRLLQASRFHPLLMDRLARLAADAGLRPQLMQALATLEASGDYAQLPELFANRSGDAQERAYLNDALATSLDQLIRAAGADARCLLWMIATANEPVTLGLLEGVWRGEDGPQQAQLREIKQMLEMLPQLPAETQAQLKALPPEFRTLLDTLPPENPARPDSAPLLQRLVSVGLATEARRDPEDANPDLSCHELVRERIRAWMERHPQDRAELTEDAIRLAYAERLAATF